jgi:hypothetical protein
MIVNGVRLEADLTGALYWPDYRVLAVADMHFEKGTSYAARAGLFLPPYDSRATLDALETVVARRNPDLVLCLGDSFHDAKAGGRLAHEDRSRIRAMTGSRDWIWIAGNHDPARPDGLDGTHLDALAIGPVVFRHEPTGGPTAGEIAGHLHPAARVAGRGKWVRRRCFAGDGARLILPAFGAYAGGLNVLDAAFAGLFEQPAFRAFMLGDDRVYPVGPKVLRPD